MNPSADWISLDSGSPSVLQTHFPRRREPTWLSIKLHAYYSGVGAPNIRPTMRPTDRTNWSVHMRGQHVMPMY